MTTSPAKHTHSVLAELTVPAVAVAVVAVIGFLLLELVKHILVDLTYALGIGFVVVGLLAAPRLLRGRTGHERWHRIRGLATTVGLGAALIVIAHLVSRHGWLLVVVPAAWVAISRGAEHLARHRHPHDSAHRDRDVAAA